MVPYIVFILLCPERVHPWAWQQQIQVESKVWKQFCMATHDKDAHHMDSILDSELDASLA